RPHRAELGGGVDAVVDDLRGPARGTLRLGRGPAGPGPRPAPPLSPARGGPKLGAAPALPLVYLPRGLDNSSGGQTWVTSSAWGPLQGQMLHFSYGTGTFFLVLREQVDGQPQGALVPLAGDFLSGAHRGKFHPGDGQLYVSGMGGWGTYTPKDGSF